MTVHFEIMRSVPRRPRHRSGDRIERSRCVARAVQGRHCRRTAARSLELPDFMSSVSTDCRRGYRCRSWWELADELPGLIEKVRSAGYRAGYGPDLDDRREVSAALREQAFCRRRLKDDPVSSPKRR